MDGNSKFYGAAAHYNKPQGFQFNGRLLTMILAVLGALAIVSVGLMLVSALSSGPRNDLATLIARESSLQKFITENQKNAKNADLSKIMSDTILYLSSDGFALKQQLVSNYGKGETSADILAGETDTISKSKLDDAAKLGRFDTAFVELLKSKLAATQEQAQKISLNSSGTLRQAANQTLTNIEIVQQQLEKLKL